MSEPYSSREQNLRRIRALQPAHDTPTWHEAAGHDTEYARTDDPRDRPGYGGDYDWDDVADADLVDNGYVVTTVDRFARELLTSGLSESDQAAALALMAAAADEFGCS